MRRRLANSAALVWLCLAFATVFSASVNAHGRIKHSHDEPASPAVARAVEVQTRYVAKSAIGTTVAARGLTLGVVTAVHAVPAIEIESTREIASTAELKDPAWVGHLRGPEETVPAAGLPSLSETRLDEVLACGRGHASVSVERGSQVWLSAQSAAKRACCSDEFGCCCQGLNGCAGCGMSCCSGAFPPSPLAHVYIDGRQARSLLTVSCDGIVVGPADRPPVLGI